MIQRCLQFAFFIACSFLLFSSELLAQISVIKGKVVSENGSPIEGVSVVNRNTGNGLATNGAGEFTINAATSHVIVFSATGFVSKEVPVGTESNLTITLIAASNELGEVVVVGYGTQQKAATTGSIASVKAADITQTPITNVAQGLQGRVAGLQVTQNNAAPGGNISVRIRGTNSINGSSEPLYIVDGIQISNGGGVNEVSPLSTINPNDIESVDILKDASATAIYGARGANGVVLITTKRGKNGPTRVLFETYAGVQKIAKKLDLLEANEYAVLENEIYNNIYPNPESLGGGTDWQDLIYRKAAMQNYQVSVNGGSEKTQFAMSGNYFNQDGVIIRSNFKRYSLRLSLDHKISNRIKIGSTILGSNSVNRGIPTGNSSMDGPVTYSGIVGATLGAPPTLKPYRDDGTIFPFVDQAGGRYSEVANPLGLAEIHNQNSTNRILANVYAEASIVKNLTYRASFNVDVSNSLIDFYSPIYIIAAANRNASSGSAAKTNVNTRALLHESILTYSKSIGEHSLKFTGVFATQNDLYSSNTINASGFPNDVTTNEALGIAINRTVSSTKSKSTLLSYMGRINYGYKNKYFVDLTARYDGASKFGENNKFGFFPAVSAAWRVIEESFMQEQELVSDLKLRGSYGLTGNAAAIGPYQSLSLSSQGNPYILNHLYTMGISPTGISNKDLKWEKSIQTNIGVDIGFWNNRLQVTVDAYKKRTDDLLFVKQLPISSGYGSFSGNFASIENKGIELAANVRLLDRAVKWNINANISFNRNKLVSLEGGLEEFVLSPYSVLQVGRPLGVFKTYVFNGIYQTGETILAGQGSRVGGTKLSDLNKDNSITAEDQRITGDANPNFIFGFSTNLNYKQFDLSAFISGVQGNQIYNLSRYSFENPLGTRNLLEGLKNRWSPTNPSNEYQNGAQGGRLPVSDRFVEDGSFVRLKNLTLGYRLPKIKFINNARIYVSGNNLFTITDYSGYDPEVNTFGGSNVLVGVDNLVYPTARTYLIGIHVGL